VLSLKIQSMKKYLVYRIHGHQPITHPGSTRRIPGLQSAQGHCFPIVEDFSTAEEWAITVPEADFAPRNLVAQILPAGPEISSGEGVSSSLAIKLRVYSPQKITVDARLMSTQPIDPEARRLGMWIQGNNREHQVYLILQDSQGQEQLLFLTKVNYKGWASVYTYLDPEQTRSGLSLAGLRIVYDPLGLSFTGDELAFALLEAAR
jgi:hypothetical protein